MTFSIAAADMDKGDWGIAVASKFPCVGAVVPWARAGVGAVATQSWANTSFGPEGLALMDAGIAASGALDRLLTSDSGREDRQVGFVDGSGRSATFTGAKCMDWAGGVTGEGFAAQGNILAGEAVAADPPRCSSCERAVATKGRNDRYIDLRVDDHADPINELVRIFEVWDESMLVRNDPLLESTPELVADLQRRLATLGRYDGDVSGLYDDATRVALGDWAGEYNLEGRLREDDRISNLLVREIRDITPELDI